MNRVSAIKQAIEMAELYKLEIMLAVDQQRCPEPLFTDDTNTIQLKGITLGPISRANSIITNETFIIPEQQVSKGRVFKPDESFIAVTSFPTEAVYGILLGGKWHRWFYNPDLAETYIFGEN